jgi:hypothetical protein
MSVSTVLLIFAGIIAALIFAAFRNGDSRYRPEPRYSQQYGSPSSI